MVVRVKDVAIRVEERGRRAIGDNGSPKPASQPFPHLGIVRFRKQDHVSPLGKQDFGNRVSSSDAALEEIVKAHAHNGLRTSVDRSTVP